MRSLWEVYVQQFKTTIAVQLQYRASLIIWLIGQILEPLIYIVVWGTVASASGGRVGSFTTGEFAAYYIVLMLVNHVTFTWIMWEYEYRIRHGSLSFALLRPVHPIHADIADNVSYKLLTMVVMIPTTVVLTIAFRPTFHPIGWAVVAFVPALALAFVMRFLIEWSLALAAFWTTRITAINQMFFVVMLFLSGQIAPLELMPHPVQVAAAILPFRWVVSFPVELLLGRLTPTEALTGLGVQLVWLALGLAILKFVWSAGVRQYSAVGS